MEKDKFLKEHFGTFEEWTKINNVKINKSNENDLYWLYLHRNDAMINGIVYGGLLIAILIVLFIYGLK